MLLANGSSTEASFGVTVVQKLFVLIDFQRVCPKTSETTPYGNAQSRAAGEVGVNKRTKHLRLGETWNRSPVYRRLCVKRVG